MYQTQTGFIQKGQKQKKGSYQGKNLEGNHSVMQYILKNNHASSSLDRKNNMPNINGKKFNQTYQKNLNYQTQMQTQQRDQNLSMLSQEHFNVTGADLFNQTFQGPDKRS